MKLFADIGNEETVIEEPVLSLEEVMINKDVDEHFNSDINLLFAQFNLGIESMLKIDLAIIGDLEAIENNEVTKAYVRISNENYMNIVTTLGMSVEGISTENITDPIETLKLSIEQKEESKKEISKKVDSLIKRIGEKLKNIGKSISHAFSTNKSLLSKLSKTISSKTEQDITFSTTTIATIINKFNANNGYADIKTLSASEFTEIVTDTSDSFNITDMLSVIKSNYSKIIKAEYKTKDMAFDKQKNTGKTGGSMINDVYANTPDSGKVLAVAIDISNGNNKVLVSTGNTNNIYKYMANKGLGLIGQKGSILDMLAGALKNKGIVEGASKTIAYMTTLKEIKVNPKSITEISVNLKTLKSVVDILNAQNEDLIKSYTMLENLNDYLIASNDLNGSEYVINMWFYSWEAAKATLERNIFVVSKVLDNYNK